MLNLFKVLDLSLSGQRHQQNVSAENVILESQDQGGEKPRKDPP